MDRNRSIDHVSVSPFDDHPAVEEIVEPVENLWSLLSWLDADREQIRLVTCSKHAMYVAILPASSSKRGMSIVMSSGGPDISSYCWLDVHFHCCPRYVRYAHRGADGSVVLVDISFRLSRLRVTGPRSVVCGWAYIDVEFALWAAALVRLF